MSEKIIYGQAWLFEDKLVQDMTKFTEDGKCYDYTNTIVSNIWDDLLSDDGEGQYKSNGKDYFYWEYTQTSVNDDNVTVTAMFTCPPPKFGLFSEPLNPEVGGKYAKYWKKQIVTRRENAEKESTIQRKEIYLDGCKYIDQYGNIVTVPNMTVNNSSDEDITNLLNNIF